MLDGKANIPAFALGGTLLGVGGRDGDCGTTATQILQNLQVLGDSRKVQFQDFNWFSQTSQHQMLLGNRQAI